MFAYASEKFPMIANEVMGTIVHDMTVGPAPLPPNLEGLNAQMRRDIMRLYESTTLKQHNDLASQVAKENMQRHKDRVSLCAAIKGMVTENLSELLEKQHPVGQEEHSGWLTCKDVITTMSRAINGHLVSISVVPEHRKIHYKDSFDAFCYNAKESLETYSRLFKEQLRLRNLMVTPSLSETDAVQEYIKRLPDDIFGPLVQRMASEEALKQTQVADDPQVAFIYHAIGYPSSLEKMITLASAFKEGCTKRASKSTTKARSFSSLSYQRNEDTTNYERNVPQSRNYSSYSSQSKRHDDSEDSDSYESTSFKRHRYTESGRSSPAGTLHNHVTNETKHWADITASDKPSEYNKKPCKRCTDMGNHDSADHFSKWHDVAIMTEIKKVKNRQHRDRSRSRSTDRDRTTRRSRSRSGSRDRQRKDKVRFEPTR